MKLKQRSRKRTAWLLAVVLCLSPAFLPGSAVAAQTEGTDSVQGSVVLKNPVIDAEKGKASWDCIYFGNYWQSEYITSQENRPVQGEADIVHTDTDGTKYIVREDAKCYKYEPVKWRVLSVNEDGTDTFLVADQCLEARPYHTELSETVTWETCALREWLNGSFMATAFSEEERAAIVQTEVQNKRNPFVQGDAEMAEDGNPTQDYVYLLSVEEAATRSYGFADNYSASGSQLSETETRAAGSTDFAGSCEEGTISGGYLLRTLGSAKGEVLSTHNTMEGMIPMTGVHTTKVNDTGHGIRPVLHLDLTKTGTWSYAGKVKQDKTVTAPDAVPSVPTASPAPQPNVTMAPGQVYPKNPVVHSDDLKRNTWDCIYFGAYYNTKFTPSVLSAAGEHDTLQEDEDGKYLVRHEEGYFRYEPIKWRVLSINEDGTDAFLMADQVVDVTQYFKQKDVEVTWEKSDVRTWLGTDFMNTVFTEEEQGKILDTIVHTEDNKWSGEPGGNDTTDKIYLPSIEEMVNTSYGFGSDENEGDTRKTASTDYAKAEEGLAWVSSDTDVYWLRSQGSKKGCPAIVGQFGNGVILKETSNASTGRLGVRPVMHVNLSDTSLWSYAGQVTPKGVVLPDKEDISASPSPEPTKDPEPTMQPPANTQKPQATVKPKVKKPGKPAIKKLRNKKGKKVTVTLSKKVSGATGYQVAYAVKASMKGQKKKSFKGTSVTVKGLKKKKTYYFRVRAYTKKNGKTVYGNWGGKKKIKVKK